MASPNFIYDTSQNSYGVYNWPNAAQSLPNEAQAEQETPYGSAPNSIEIQSSTPGLFTGTTLGNLLNSLTGKGTQDSAGNFITPQNASILGASGVSTGFLTWLEGGFADASIRIGVVILGFILVAAGLTMFKNGTVEIKLKR